MAHNLKFNDVKQKHLALISPLDWGLGHTTRCIPIIHILRQKGYQVVVACNSKQKAILLNEFVDIDFEDIEGYSIRYGRSAASTLFLLIAQIPKMLIQIKREKAWLARFEAAKHPVLIISDNRFGFYSTTIKSIFITHQLHIETGLGNFCNRFIQKINYRFISRFSECWVPDIEVSPGLGGKLSHPEIAPPVTTHYIGNLSRMDQAQQQSELTTDLLVILSGPEPQRTIFESLILEQLKSFEGFAVVVRGLPGQSNHINSLPNVAVINYANSKELNQMMLSAKLIVSRCGYTTVMDLMKLQKKSVLIPTPGQAEQEYLAKHLLENNLALTFRQNEFNLVTALKVANNFNYKQIHLENPELPVEYAQK